MKLFIYIIALHAINIFAQNSAIQYYENVNLAEHFLLNNKYIQSDSCFKKAFQIAQKKGFNQDYLTSAINSMRMGDTMLTNSYLIDFAKRGGNYKMLKNDFTSNKFLEENSKSLLQYILLKKNYLLEKELKKKYKEYANTVNWKLIKKVNRMYFSDQVVARGFFTNILPRKTQTKIMNKIDSKHARKILDICKDYGYWIGFDLLGEYRFYGKYRLDKIDILIRHFNQNDLDAIEKYIIGAIKNLEYYPYTWASCLDWAQIKEPRFNAELNVFEQTQLYGTMSYNVDGKNAIMPYGKISDVSVKRKELYLSNIYDYSLIRKLELPLIESIIINKK